MVAMTRPGGLEPVRPILGTTCPGGPKTALKLEIGAKLAPELTNRCSPGGPNGAVRPFLVRFEWDKWQLSWRRGWGNLHWTPRDLAHIMVSFIRQPYTWLPDNLVIRGLKSPELPLGSKCQLIRLPRRQKAHPWQSIARATFIAPMGTN